MKNVHFNNLICSKEVNYRINGDSLMECGIRIWITVRPFYKNNRNKNLSLKEQNKNLEIPIIISNMIKRNCF